MEKKIRYEESRGNRVNGLLLKFLAVLLIVLSSSCKKLVTVSPPVNTVNSGNVFENDATAISAINNIYAAISANSSRNGGITSMNIFPGLSADELSLYNGATNNAVNYYYTNSLSSTNLNGQDFWTSFYRTIFEINAALEGLSAATSLTPAVKQQLTGESTFMRAFCYFYLVNLYGDVPLVLTTDYTANAILARSSRSAVYQEIVSDLKVAKNLLSQTYLNGTLTGITTERVRPTRWTAGALLARVYLYTSDYSDAETEAGAVIANTSLFGLTALSEVFQKNSREAIWQLQPVNAGWNTEDARAFVLPASGPNSSSYPFYLSPQLLSGFEWGDHRRTKWVDSVITYGGTYYYPAKYKNAAFNNPVTEYEMVFRLSELYLVRAEARAQQNKIIDAQADLDSIRSRAGLPNTMANNGAALMTGILRERQVELFTEWGHRWLDLKRTGNVSAVMSVATPAKGGTWNSSWQWYPIPRSELQLNSHLVQNPGY